MSGSAGSGRCCIRPGGSRRPRRVLLDSTPSPSRDRLVGSGLARLRLGIARRGQDGSGLAHWTVDRVCRRLHLSWNVRAKSMTREMFRRLTGRREILGIVQTDRLVTGGADGRVCHRAPPRFSEVRSTPCYRGFDVRSTSTVRNSQQRHRPRYSKSATIQELRSKVSAPARREAPQTAFLANRVVISLVATFKEFPAALAVVTSVMKMRHIAGKIEVARLAGEAELEGEFFSPENVPGRARYAPPDRCCTRVGCHRSWLVRDTRPQGPSGPNGPWRRRPTSSTSWE